MSQKESEEIDVNFLAFLSRSYILQTVGSFYLTAEVTEGQSD